MLKQQEGESAEIFYGPRLTADSGKAPLFQILTSTTAVEIPTVTPNQHLGLISPPTEKLQESHADSAARIWGNTVP